VLQILDIVGQSIDPAIDPAHLDEHEVIGLSTHSTPLWTIEFRFIEDRDRARFVGN